MNKTKSSLASNSKSSVKEINQSFDQRFSFFAKKHSSDMDTNADANAEADVKANADTSQKQTAKKKSSWFLGIYRRFGSAKKAGSAAYDNQNSGNAQAQESQKTDHDKIDPKDVENWAFLARLNPEFLDTLSSEERAKVEAYVQSHPEKSLIDTVKTNNLAHNAYSSSLNAYRYSGAPYASARASFSARSSANSSGRSSVSSKKAHLDSEKAKSDLFNAFFKDLDKLLGEQDPESKQNSLNKASQVMPGINVPPSPQKSSAEDSNDMLGGSEVFQTEKSQSKAQIPTQSQGLRQDETRTQTQIHSRTKSQVPSQSQTQSQSKAQIPTQSQSLRQNESRTQNQIHSRPHSRNKSQAKAQFQAPSQTQAQFQPQSLVQAWAGKTRVVDEGGKLPSLLQNVVQHGLQQEQVDEAIELSLGMHGVFEQQIASFRYRPGQVQMAKHIGACLFEDPKVQLLEAGTGIGKTFAYLTSLVLSQSKVLISTHLLSLQQQLFLHDIPQVLGLLGIKQRVSYAVLMGKSQYLCRLKVGMLIYAPEVVNYFVPQNANSLRQSDLSLNNVQAKFEKQRQNLLQSIQDAVRCENLSPAQLEQHQSFWLEALAKMYQLINAQYEKASEPVLLSTAQADGQPPFWGEEPFLSRLSQEIGLPAQISSKWLDPLTIDEHQCECQYCPFRRQAQCASLNIQSSSVSYDSIGCWYERACDTANDSQVVLINHSLLCSKLISRRVIRLGGERLQLQAEAQASQNAQVAQAFQGSQAFQPSQFPFAEQAASSVQAKPATWGNAWELESSSNQNDEKDRDATISLSPILKRCQALVIDEAHAFQAIFTKTYTDCLDAKSLWKLAQNLFEYANSGTAPDPKTLKTVAQGICRLILILGSQPGYAMTAIRDEPPIKQMFRQYGVFGLIDNLYFDLTMLIDREKNKFVAQKGNSLDSNDFSLQMRLLHFNLGVLLDLSEMNALVENPFCSSSSMVSSSHVGSFMGNAFGGNANSGANFGASYTEVQYGNQAQQSNDSYVQTLEKVGFVGAFSVTSSKITLKPQHALKKRADSSLADFVEQDRNCELNYAQTVYNFKIELRPINMESLGTVFFQTLLKNNIRPILTSATLQVAQQTGRETSAMSFHALREHLGLLSDWVVAREFDSPFDYAHHSLVWWNDQGFAAYSTNGSQQRQRSQSFECMCEVLARIPGGILVITTNYEVINEYANLFARYLHQRKVFKQPKNDAGALEGCLNQYKAAIARGEQAVLIGTVSYSTGIDLPGAEVQAIVIDRLNFPLLSGIEKQLQAYNSKVHGSYWHFSTQSLPAALVALKQTCGRLIRTEQDWGVVILASKLEKNYKTAVSQMFQPMAQTSNKQDVLNFVQRMQGFSETSQSLSPGLGAGVNSGASPNYSASNFNYEDFPF